jgi:hypothetical protein
MSETITFQLTADEAIVLFEYFARFQESDERRLRNNAEYIAFSRIAATLESTLVAPFQSDYDKQLSAAAKRLAEGYEGSAPGVHP